MPYIEREKLEEVKFAGEVIEQRCECTCLTDDNESYYVDEDCSECEGEGMVLTSEGKKLLLFVRKYTSNPFELL